MSRKPFRSKPLFPKSTVHGAWLKYMVAALCGALLMLAILLMLKLPEDTHNEPASEIKYDDVSGVSFGEPFDFTWVD